MSKSIKLLNAARDYIINHCNENGINLHDHFDNPDEFKRFVMALVFKVAVDAGFSVKDAFDAVAGADAYDNLVETVWNAAQK